MGGDGRESWLVTAIGTAGAAALIYLAGGALMRVELHHHGLPTDEVIASIPREKLIVVGIKGLLAPAAALAGAVLLLRAVVVWWRPTPAATWLEGLRWAILIVVGAVPLWLGADRDTDEPGVGAWQLLTVVAALGIAACFATVVSMRDVKSDAAPPWWQGTAQTGVVLFGAYIFVSLALLWARPIRLPPVRVTFDDRTRVVAGYLVANRTDALYVAEVGGTLCMPLHLRPTPPTSDGKRRLGPLVVIPRGAVDDLRLGRVISVNGVPTTRDGQPVGLNLCED